MHNYKLTIEYGIAASLYRLHQRDPQRWWTAAEISDAITGSHAKISPRSVSLTINHGGIDQYLVTEHQHVQTMHYQVLYRFVRGVHPDFVEGQ